MNNDLLNISLNQGKKFNSYQKKITEKISSKEGFVSLEQDKVSNNIIQQSIDNYPLAAIGGVSSNNSYLGKNLQFTDGTIVYVTNDGIIHPYTSEEIFNKTIGKNGCPKEIVYLTIPWTPEYKQGYKFSTNPNLIVGSNIVMGQSCGNDIELKMEQLYNQNNQSNNNFKEIDINSEQFKKGLENYKLTKLKIQQKITGSPNFQNNNIEGMHNLSNPLDLNDLNGMLSDSDLRVSKENYSYILWSILAVGIIAITINTMKNRN